MDKKYNGFNNGRDTTDGVGGWEVNHGTQQTMTKEQILEKNNNVRIFDHFYDGKQNITVERALKAMEEYAQQEVAKEREKAKKLVEAAKSVMKSWNERMNNEIEEEKENKHGPYKYWSPAASMVASSEINKLRQSLTEYEKS